MTKKSSAGVESTGGQFRLMAILLVVALSVLFFQSFLPGMVHFNNDGPFGAISSAAAQLPSGYKGLWQDLNWIGGESIGASPDLSNTLGLVLRPVGFAKFYPMLACLTVGLCAWFLFRQLGLAAGACVLGGLAAGLNSCFLSTACWGVAAQPICFGANYLALAALCRPSRRHAWVCVVLAGFAVGWGVMEGFDIGAILSLVVAAFALFFSLNVEGRKVGGKDVALGFVRIAIVAVMAGLIAFQTVTTLINTQVKGVVGMSEEEKGSKEQWQYVTQWSVPKIETLQIFVPGIFGYRMFDYTGHRITSDSYWGKMGMNPGVAELEKMRDGSDPKAREFAEGRLADFTFWRFSGTGLYAGVLVVVLALWAVLQSFRKAGSPYSPSQRRMLWFCAAITVIALLISYGKYAPFYQLFYALPHASAIRNPFKFVHVFSWALIILFAYGADGLIRSCMHGAASRGSGWVEQYQSWRANAPAFDRYWMMGCFIALALGVAGFVKYAISGAQLQKYLQTIAVPAANAPAIAATSIHSVAWFVLFLAATVGALALIMSRQFTGANARSGVLLLGVILVADLGRADFPWTCYWDYPYKYATNPIIDFLRDKPYNHRVAIAPLQGGDDDSGMFKGLYDLEWKQQLFQYYNVQSLDRVQEPREAQDNHDFRLAVPAENPATMARHWELTNTRYLLGPAGGVNALNQQIDPGKQRFRLIERFRLSSKNSERATSLTDITAVPDPNGAVGVIEFTGALPRAGLYSNWRVITNREETLGMLGKAEFNPATTVLLADPIPAPLPANTNQPAGTVEIQPNYQPKRIELHADVKVPAVLLLNDKYSPHWNVTVDGKPDKVLKANFQMRGLYLQPGSHDIVFTFEVSMAPFFVSLATVLVGLGLCGWLAFGDNERRGKVTGETKAGAENRKSAKGKSGKN